MEAPFRYRNAFFVQVITKILPHFLRLQTTTTSLATFCQCSNLDDWRIAFLTHRFNSHNFKEPTQQTIFLNFL